VRGGLAPAGGAAKLSPLTASNTFQTSRHRSPQVIHNAEASDEYYDDNDDEAVSSSEHLYTSLSGRYRITSETQRDKKDNASDKRMPDEATVPHNKAGDDGWASREFSKGMYDSTNQSYNVGMTTGDEMDDNLMDAGSANS
jgi:hypothetical protein